MRITLALSLAFCISVFSPYDVNAASQFKTFKAAMQMLNDYDPAYNELQITSESPLVFTIIQRADPKDAESLKAESAQLALVYGIYRAFCHLDVSEITISSTVGYGYPPDKLHADPAIMLKATVSRRQAMAALEKVFPASPSCEGIIGENIGGVMIADIWTEKFSLFKSKKANQDLLIQALRAEGAEVK